MAVEIIGCRLLSLDGTKALYMPDVEGGAPFTQVDVTLLGNTYYTTGPEITDADFLSRHKLTPWSDASFSEISVIAHSDCTLEARVTHLERLLMEMLSGKVLIPELQVKNWACGATTTSSSRARVRRRKPRPRRAVLCRYEEQRGLPLRG